LTNTFQPLPNRAASYFAGKCSASGAEPVEHGGQITLVHQFTIMSLPTMACKLDDVIETSKVAMNVDPSTNVVVIEVAINGRLEKLVGSGPTRAENCVQSVWHALAAEHGAAPNAVRRVYSEWDPSADDKAFIDATFPDNVEVTYSFPRPTASDWDQAMRAAEATIAKAGQKRTEPPRKAWWQFWK
jgi:hypothetical protein